MEKTCSKCGELKHIEEYYVDSRAADGHTYVCKDCRDVYGRMWNKKNSVKNTAASIKWRTENPEKSREYLRRYKMKNTHKIKAQNMLNRALQASRIARPETCSVCGATPPIIHGHHHDYSKHLDVVWVCPPCHAELHREINRKKREAADVG